MQSLCAPLSLSLSLSLKTSKHAQRHTDTIQFARPRTIKRMETTKMGLVPKKWESGILKMKVVAEIFTGSLFYVEVAEDATVGDLKKEIKNEIVKQENLPVDRMILLLDAEKHYLLDKDEASIKDYGVQDSSRIYIFFRFPASIDSPSTPKESASSEPSHSMDYATGTPNLDNKDEANDNEAPSDDASDPSASVDQQE